MTPAQLQAVSVVAWMTSEEAIEIEEAVEAIGDLEGKLRKEIIEELRINDALLAGADRDENMELHNLVAALKVRQEQMQERDARALRFLEGIEPHQGSVVYQKIEQAIHALRERIASPPGE